MKKNNVLKIIISIILIVGLCYAAIFGIKINGKQYLKPVSKIKTGLDISGGVSIVYQADTEEKANVEDLKKAIGVLRKRLENKNIYEAMVRLDENKGHIYLEIPADTKGAKDPLEVVEGIDKTAVVTFRDADGNILLSGTDIESAEFSENPTDESGLPNPHTILRFSKEGREKFKDATKNNVGKILYIYLDEMVISDPYVNSEIDAPDAIITFGKDDYEEKKKEAQETAMLIDSGSLPFSLNIINKEFIGPTLGQKALEVSMYAGIISLIFVVIFMLVVYKIPGVVAALALIAYSAILMIVMVYAGITLTLPGIASLILSIGMAVDANVIIFERLKEELRNGRSPERAFENSFSKALKAIVDGNITTLVIALFLYIFGVGTIKGFGLVLGLGVVLSMFTAVFITKFLLRQFIGLAKKYKGIFAVKGVK